MSEVHTRKQFLLYVLLSLSAGIVEASSFAVFSGFIHLKYEWAHVFSVVLSVLYNFTLNRRYTFQSANNVPVAMAKAAVFYLFFIPISAHFGQLAADAGINNALIKALTMATNMAGEFIWWKFVVFRGSENTNNIALRSPAVPK